MLFTDDAAVVAHLQAEVQSLMDCFSKPCKGFGFTISLKKANVLGQDFPLPSVITIDNFELYAAHQFTYLGSTIMTISHLTSVFLLSSERTPL